MTVIDFKKTQRDLYRPKTSPSIIEVPEMIFIAVDGVGNPNISSEYAKAIETLYGLSYTIKMGNKKTLEYVVLPLEGFWSMADGATWDGCSPIDDKNSFMWTMLIRQPDFVNQEIFDAAIESLAKKKPHLDTSKARLIPYTEGLSVQAMHLGSYDDEPKTIAAMNRFAADNGYRIDLGDERRHHEIYLSDPRKVVPEKLKTIIRHPIC